MIGFVLGVLLAFFALVVVQYLVIRVSADDLGYRFGKYVFDGPRFPKGDLEQGRVVRRCLFPVKVTVTFYNAQYQEVTQADKPGRYGAVVRIGLNGGIVEHRYITLYHTPVEVFWWETALPVTAQLPPEVGLNPAVLDKQKQEIGDAIRNGFFGGGDVSPDLAILLAGLSETSPGDPPAAWRNDVVARNDKWWFGLRQRLGLADKYPYLVDLPQGYDADAGKHWPLILYLHGGVQRGTDLKLVRKSGVAGLIAKGKQIPAIVISPQCSWHQDWDTPVLSQLLDEVCAKYRVDPDRIYLTGISGGGDAVWSLALEYPDRFAAIAPIAGEGDPMDAARIKNLPVWAFEGQKDTVVPPSQVVGMVDAIRQAGGRAHLTLFAQAGHDSWDDAYATDALYTWLLAQKRGQPEVITPGVPTP
ncbi:MAG: dienelactone hydrolase family protein [Methylacidiphilales bacterium]|nr:dienelactone hydrolase family protein [Candidatus Methylacidiphilales bacterium]